MSLWSAVLLIRHRALITLQEDRNLNIGDIQNARSPLERRASSPYWCREQALALTICLGHVWEGIFDSNQSSLLLTATTIHWTYNEWFLGLSEPLSLFKLTIPLPWWWTLCLLGSIYSIFYLLFEQRQPEVRLAWNMLSMIEEEYSSYSSHPWCQIYDQWSVHSAHEAVCLLGLERSPSSANEPTESWSWVVTHQ